MTNYCHSREGGNLELKGLQMFHKATPVENSLIPLVIVQSQLSALEKIFPSSKKRKGGTERPYLLQIPPSKGEYRIGNEMKQDFTLVLSARRVQMGMFLFAGYNLHIR